MAEGQGTQLGRPGDQVVRKLAAAHTQSREAGGVYSKRTRAPFLWSPPLHGSYSMRVWGVRGGAHPREAVFGQVQLAERFEDDGPRGDLKGEVGVVELVAGEEKGLEAGQTGQVSDQTRTAPTEL